MKHALVAAAVLAFAILAVWEGVLWLGWISPAALAHPGEVACAIPRLLAPSGGLSDVISTLSRSVIAFVASIPIGVGFGFGIFFSRSFRRPASFLLDFLRSIPATALVPVFFILFGIGDLTKVAVGAFSSSLIICLATLAGLSSRNETRLGIAAINGLVGTRRLLLLDLPEALPQIFLGLRAGISLALILVVICEMLIGSNRGLGKIIADMRYTDDKPKMYAAIVLAGLIGYGLNWILAKIENRIVHWRGSL